MENLAQRWTARLRALKKGWLAGAVGWLSRKLGGATSAEQTRLVAAAQIALEVQQKGTEDDASDKAAALAYSGFLALLPLVLLGLSVTGFALAGSQPAWFERLTRAVPGLSELVDTKLTTLVDGRYGLGIVGAVTALWAASTLSNRAERILGQVFGEHRSVVSRRLSSIVVTVVLGSIVLATIAVSGSIAAIHLGNAFDIPLRVSAVLLLVMVEIAYFALTYRLLAPPKDLRLRDHLPGAIVMGLGFEVLKDAGGLFISRIAARSEALYGTIGALFGLLVFMRLAMWVFVYGAEVSSVLWQRRRGT
ncbi:MAG: YihY/virulence factor BrkB family protein [Actinomycetota bacterium]